MNILITGGFGYLGQRLGKFFQDSGAKIYLGSRQLKENPKWLKDGSCILTDWSDIDLSINKIKSIDLVIHSAGMNASDCYENPEQAHYSNGVITKRLLDSCIKNEIKNFILLSTAHVYCDPLEGIISEETLPKNFHPYAKSNVEGENFVIEADKYGYINSKVLRLSNCFGAPLSAKANCWNLLVNDICMQVVKNKKIKLKSNGSQLRDFVPINEFCRTLDYIAKNCMEDKKYNVFNIGGKTFSILEMANLVAQIYTNKYNDFIKIEKEETTNKNNSNFLQYKMDWLKKYNFEKSFEPNEEIEDLLSFCVKNFKI